MPAPSRRAPSPAAPRATLPVALLALTVALGGALAYEARSEVRSHRETAERLLRDYATGQAQGVLARTAGELAATVTRALAPATEEKAASPYDLLPPPEVVDAGALAAVAGRCAGGDSLAPVFRLDLRDNSLATRAPLADADGRALAAAVGTHARTSYRADDPFATIPWPGRGAASADRLVVYGVKRAPHQAPVAAYGFVTCGAVVRQLLLAAWAREAGDSLLALAALAPDGHLLARSAAWDSTAAARTVAARVVGGVTLRAALAPAATRRIVVQTAGRPGIPLLLAFLSLTAGLAAVALAQLRRAHDLARLRADFTSSVSHELRTPLAQIMLFGETLALDRVRTPAERREAAETIVHEARRLLRLVENVLQFAQAERGSVQLEPRAVALSPLVQSIAAGFTPVAAAARVHLALALDDDATGWVDAAAVRQVVLNLLDNAVKYGPAEQTVAVGTAAAGDRVRISVEDGGPGVPEPDRERIWAPFVRLTRDLNAYAAGGQARTGSGIGLAVVRDLTARMGGRAWVEPGRRGGALFVVELPAAPPARAGSSGGVAARPSHALPAAAPDEAAAWSAPA